MYSRGLVAVKSTLFTLNPVVMVTLFSFLISTLVCLVEFSEKISALKNNYDTSSPWLVYLLCCTPRQNMNIQWMTHCRLQLTPPLSPMLQCSVHSTSYNNVISYYWQPLSFGRSMYWTLNPFIWSEQNISLKMDTCLFFSVHNVCFSCPMRKYKFLILEFLSQ